MAIKIGRIYELAKHYKISSNAMVTLLRDLGLAPKSHMSVATPEMIAAVNMKIAREREAAKKEMAEKQKAKAARQRSARPSRPSTGADKRPLPLPLPLPQSALLPVDLRRIRHKLPQVRLVLISAVVLDNVVAPVEDQREEGQCAEGRCLVVDAEEESRNVKDATRPKLIRVK